MARQAMRRFEERESKHPLGLQRAGSCTAVCDPRRSCRSRAHRWTLLRVPKPARRRLAAVRHFLLEGGSSSYPSHSPTAPAQATPLRGVRREYLRQLNLYRTRIWTCASTGQGGLTYEEALTSEAQQRCLSQVCREGQR